MPETPVPSSIEAPTSPFDDAFLDSSQVSEDVMGWDIVVNGVEVRGVVDEIDLSNRRLTGMMVKNIVCSIYLTADAALKCDALAGGIVTFKGKRVVIDTAADLGGAGVRLDCIQPNQRKVSVPGL